jgi:hypothetical protein
MHEVHVAKLMSCDCTFAITGRPLIDTPLSFSRCNWLLYSAVMHQELDKKIDMFKNLRT